MRYSFYLSKEKRELSIDSFGVAFRARRLKNARVAWINERFFLSQGVNIYSALVRTKIINDLLATYGVCIENEMTTMHLLNEEVELVADRYGGSKGSPHGGSGRCGFVGDYNAKGIGKTPLVGDNVDWGHSHGFMWLGEAIREVINSEVASEELPNSAVPTLAIIDTGLDYEFPDGQKSERCAIVIRQNFLRPAHFERSIYFGSSGSVSSDQYIDEARTKSAVNSIGGCSEYPSSEIFLERMFVKISDQVGASRALRLWQGQFLTSNISIDGALVDFGSFRAVANWRRARGLAGENFGDEGGHFRSAINSLSFYFNKFSEHGVRRSFNKELLASVESRANETFIECNLMGLGLHGLGNISTRIGGLINEYYDIQQSQKVEVDNPIDLRRFWIFDIIGKNGKNIPNAPKSEIECAHALKESLVSTANENHPVFIKNVIRWFMPRPLMYFNVSSKWAKIVENRYLKHYADGEYILRSYIDRNLIYNRRYWPHIPKNYIVVSQAIHRGTFIIRAFDMTLRMNCLLVEYFMIGANYYLAGCIFGALANKLKDIKIRGNHYIGVFGSDGFDANFGDAIHINDKRIELPTSELCF